MSIAIPFASFLRLIRATRKSQAQASEALNLQSSATLGTGKASTHQHRLNRLEDQEVRRALDGRSTTSKRHHRNDHPLAALSNSEDDVVEDSHAGRMYVDRLEDSADEEDVPEGTSRANPVVIVDSGFSTTAEPQEEIGPITSLSPPTVGSALKRNADGTVAAPRISKRKPKSANVGISLSVHEPP